MRQEGRRAVAPLNTDPRWPDGYIGVLRDLGAVEKTSRIAWLGRAVSLRGFPKGGDAIWGERRLKHS